MCVCVRLSVCVCVSVCASVCCVLTQMDGGYDDLGPPTDLNDLALDAAAGDIGGGRELDDAAEMMDGMDPGGFEGAEFDAPEFNPDMGDQEQVRCLCVWVG